LYHNADGGRGKPDVGSRTVR